MDRQVIIRKALRGGVVVFSAVALQYVIAFVTQVALARMLEPKHFGALAFATMVAMCLLFRGKIRIDFNNPSFSILGSLKTLGQQ